MRGKGITYDTGFFPGGKNTRETFDSEVVRKEMRVIADDLHCTAVRISGGEPARLSVAGEHAVAAGLEVWMSPFPVEMTAEQMVPYFADCAERAEQLRHRGAEVVLVTGCELSFFAAGFVPGEDSYARMATLTSGDPALWASLQDVPAQMNGFLAESVAAVRERFGGRVTYAAGPWELIDWTPFDIVSVDAYRDGHNAATYRDDLRRHFAHGKPVAVTEFGCCTYKDAGERGANGWMVVDESSRPPRVSSDLVRDEGEQVRYLRELLEVFEGEGVDSAFWFTFARYGLTHRPDDPEHDLDLASYGVVKMMADGQGRAPYVELGWEPKESFHALAQAYAP